MDKLPDATSGLEGAMEWTLEDWCDRIKNIGRDVPVDKFAEMLLDTSDLPTSSKKNKSTTSEDSLFEPLGYSIIDRDEKSYQARLLKHKDITLEGIEPSNISWRISPEDSISLFKSRLADDTINRSARGVLAKKEENGNDQSLLYRTTDLLDRIKDLPSDVSGSDMADMFLPSQSGKSIKQRLADDPTVFSDVPNISDISNLIKAGLSSEELINELLGYQTTCPNRKLPSVSTSQELESGFRSSARLSNRPTIPRRKLNTTNMVISSASSSCLKENIHPAEKDGSLNNVSDDSFIPMSYSIIDRDEESILKKYHMANDLTLHGIENSNISWQLSLSDITLFKEHAHISKGVKNSNTSFLRPIDENHLLEEPVTPPTRLPRSPRQNPEK